jgi:hypothetical protein
VKGHRTTTFLGVTLIALFIAVKTAVAFPGIPVNVEVGLDDGTKALLSTLPGNIRDAFVEAVQKSLQLVDFSVVKYIAAIEEAAKNTTRDISCTGQGVLINSAKEIESGIKTLILGGLAAKKGEFTPVGIDPISQELLKNVEDTKANLKWDTSSVKLFATYSDLSIASAKFICRAQSLNAPTAFGDREYQLNRRSLGEWQILVDQCEDTQRCLKKRLDDIVTLVNSPDPAVKATNAKGAFEKIRGAGATAATPETDWFRLKTRLLGTIGIKPIGGFDIDKVEGVLFALRDIELRVAAQKSRWQWQASQEWSKTKGLMDKVCLSDINDELHKRTNIVTDSSNAFNNLSKVKSKLQASRAAISNAIQLDPRLKEIGGAQLIDIGNKSAEAAGYVEEVCGVYLNTPGVLGGRRFNESYGAFTWCRGHPSNRWRDFPTTDNKDCGS